MEYLDLRDALNEWIEINSDPSKSNTTLVSSLLEEKMKMAIFLGDCAYCCSLESEYKQAIQYLKAGLLIQPNQFGLLANLGLQYWNLNRLKKGLFFINQSLLQKPKNIQVLEYRFALLIEMKRYAGALKTAEMIQSLDPDNGRNYLNKGKALIEMGLYNTAIENLVKAMNLEPSNKIIPGLISEVYYQYLDNVDEALKYNEIEKNLEDDSSL